MQELYGKMNAAKVDYFDINELLKDFKLSVDNLSHLQDTSIKFSEYMDFLSDFDNKSILYFLIKSFNDEIEISNLIEDHIIHPRDINESNIFLDSLSISNKRIKDLHAFSADNQGEYEYRNQEAWVHSVRNGIETIYWYAVKPEDIQKFMSDFLKYYRTKSGSLIDSSIYIKSALVHLLFMRIHPFKDGNGRTSRLLHDMKFVELVNKTYNYNLKISPLHISQSIWRNRSEYYKRINALYFDLKHPEENYKALNDWINFILNMYDEELNFMNLMLSNSSMSLEYIQNKASDDELINKEANKIKLSKVKR
ncbi:MAG: Fic family protein [Bacilli bacterium]|nr:Fic family protein [Bacilli bacterium]